MIREWLKFIFGIIFFATLIAAVIFIGRIDLRFTDITRWRDAKAVPEIKENTIGLTRTATTSNQNSAGKEEEIKVEETAPKIEETKKDILKPVEVSVSKTAGLAKPQGTETVQNGILTRAGVILQTNQQRQTYLGADSVLTENPLLDIAAQNKVNDMFASQYFEHTSPKGVDASALAIAAGYEYIAIGENLAMGDYENDADVVQAWMNSVGHRANILKAGYWEIGVAVGYGMFKGRKTWLAVQEFGTPVSVCPKVAGDLSAEIDQQKKFLDSLSLLQKNLAAKINQEKSIAETLQSEYDKLVASGANNDTAETKWEELRKAIAKVNADVNDYNVRVREMKEIYASYTANVEKYNLQVSKYNSCIAMLE